MNMEKKIRELGTQKTVTRYNEWTMKVVYLVVVDECGSVVI
jgi:hypothetical protein